MVGDVFIDVCGNSVKPSAQRAFRPMLRSNGQKNETNETNEPFGDGQNGNRNIFTHLHTNSIRVRFVRFVVPTSLFHTRPTRPCL